MATDKIDTPKKRKKLTIRREPFWHTFAKGRSLGYRKTKTGGSWIIKHGRKQSRLGDVTDYTYQEALAKAMATTKCAEADDPKSALTLHDVLRQYQVKKAAEHGEVESLSTLKYFENSLSSSLLGTLAVDLTLEQLNQWKHAQVFTPDKNKADIPESLDRTRASKATCNRRLNTLKAALSYVYGSSFIGGWSELKRFKNVDKPRELFLSPEQVEGWLRNTEGAFHNFSKASALTGCRPGELRLLTVDRFEILNGAGLLNIKFSKTGPRTQRLSSEATVFFEAISKDRNPNEAMLLNEAGKQWTNGFITKQIKDIRLKGIIPVDCVMYSLRHFYISRALLSGFNPIALARNVGTSVHQFEVSYAKFMANDIYSMLDAVNT